MSRFRHVGLVLVGVALAAGCGGADQPAAGGRANGKIAFVRSGVIYVIEADGGGLTPLTSESEGYASDPTWSPDGTKIAFTRGCRVYVMGAEGKRVKRSTARADPCAYEPSWSPDGTKIAFVKRPTVDHLPRGVVWVMNADGTGARALSQRSVTSRSFNDLYPAWSPDGTKIAFARDDFKTGGNHETPSIYVMNADGTGQIRVTRRSDGMQENMPAWAPDAARISFGKGSMSRMSVYAVDADGSGEEDLTRGVNPEAKHPSWSPDGRKIVFAGIGIAIMNADGTDVKVLTDDLADDMPDWQPLP